MPSSKNGALIRWLGFALTVLCVSAGIIVFAWKSQASQDTNVQDNAKDIVKIEVKNEALDRYLGEMKQALISINLTTTDTHDRVIILETRQKILVEDVNTLKQDVGVLKQDVSKLEEKMP